MWRLHPFTWFLFLFATINYWIEEWVDRARKAGHPATAVVEIEAERVERLTNRFRLARLALLSFLLLQFFSAEHFLLAAALFPVIFLVSPFVQGGIAIVVIPISALILGSFARPGCRVVTIRRCLRPLLENLKIWLTLTLPYWLYLFYAATAHSFSLPLGLEIAIALVLGVVGFTALGVLVKTVVGAAAASFYVGDGHPYMRPMLSFALSLFGVYVFLAQPDPAFDKFLGQTIGGAPEAIRYAVSAFDVVVAACLAIWEIRLLQRWGIPFQTSSREISLWEGRMGRDHWDESTFR